MACVISNLTLRKPIDGKDLSKIIKGEENTFDRYIFSRQGNQPLSKCNVSVRNDRYRLVVTNIDTSLYDMKNDPSQKTDISGSNIQTKISFLSVYNNWEKELVDNYQSITTIDAGFPGEMRIVLPVQDATLSGRISYSSIYPNQAHTENWQQDGDSILWKINIKNSGTYRVELEYGCPPGETGSKMVFYSQSGTIQFTIEKPFESLILPEKDYVKRAESAERTWAWMTIGYVTLLQASEFLGIKLLRKMKDEAGLIKAIRLVKQQNWYSDDTECKIYLSKFHNCIFYFPILIVEE